MKAPTRHQVQQFAARVNPVSAAVAVAVGSLTITGTANGANTFVEEMIVTATRRDVSTQDVPFNISAVSGEALEKRQIEDIAQFARWVPGLTVVDQGLRSANTLTMRGLTASSTDASEGLLNSGGGTVRNSTAEG
jgi:iron complex outermembrane receptor protein